MKMYSVQLVFLATLISLTLLFIGCKKESTDKMYYMTMDIDNSEAVSFDDSVLFASKNNSSFPLEINAFSKTNGTLRIGLSDTVATNYTEQLFNSYATNFIYEFSLNRWMYDNGNLFIKQCFLSNQVSNPISIIITKINSTYVEGTFTGSVGDGTNDGTLITNGKFRVPFL